MSLLRIGLRIWIASTSVASFLAGWIVLAHSPKPGAQSAASGAPVLVETPIPTLIPLAPLNLFNGNNNDFQGRSFSVQPAPQPQIQTQNFYAPPPAFVTGGS